jgi:hypothetical protein
MRKLRGAAGLFLLAGLLLVAFGSDRALAKGDEPADPDGLPRTSVKHPWKFFPGEARVDTLPFPIPDLVPAARREFESDNWIIIVQDPSRGLVVTRWKQIHHPLVWLFQGKTFARVTVQMRPLGANRTQVAFRGELASHHSFQGSPILPAARRAYAKAASNWRRNVTADLTSRGASR